MRPCTLRSLAFAFAALALAAPSAPAQSTTGQWQDGPNLPYFPVHMSLMPNGKVLMWPGDGGVSGNDPRQLDPVTGIVTSLAAPGYDIFCAGQSWLPDGQLFVAGGHISNNVGLPAAVTYDPVANLWTRQPSMNAGRWYPSEQVMPNGDVLVVSGDTDLTVGEDTLPQVWQTATGSWRSLTSAQIDLGLYPTLSLAPNGQVFNSGPNTTTRSLDITGTGAWTTLGTHIFTGYRDYDGMVMYQPGKILVAGGSDPATNTAEVIDLTQPSPAWRSTANMNYARRQMNALMLPDGKVLVTGGTGGPGFSNPDPTLAVYAAEEWDPATGQWTVLASATIPRLYHSVSMLMPDGRVLSTGGNSYTQSEFFSPPYLFAGPRPTITSAPTSVTNGQTFFLTTPDAANITQVSWVRVPSTTHTYSMSQAFYSTTNITRGTGGITITSPNDPTMPPGEYMLFILNSGVPSVASILHLGPTPPNNPVPVASSLSPGSIPVGSSPFPLIVNGSNFSTDSAVEIDGTTIQTSFISASQISAIVPASYMATIGTNLISVFTPSPGGGNSATLVLTVTPTPTPNLTQIGSIIARITAPTGQGSKNLEVIRDGDMPPPGTKDTRREYDTYNGGGLATDDWIGYQYTAPQTFATVVYEEGVNFPDGGWFNNLNVQVRQNGSWVSVSNLVSTPTYPANDGVGYETYKLTFQPISGDAIRIDGAPGGTSYFTSTGELTVYGPTAPDLTHSGTIIASVPVPTGTGNKNLEVIRDGDMPPVGTKDPTREYDSYNGGQPSNDAWIGYQYSSPQSFGQVVFQEGESFPDGGWLVNPTIQVRQSGLWVPVTGVIVTPAYQADDGLGFVTYTFAFTPITGDAIRIDGQPGGSSYFFSVGEMDVYGAVPAASSPTPTVTAISPASANNGDAPFTLAVTGANFVSGSTIEWNGASRPTTLVSSTQLTAAIPASDVANVGTAQVTVATAGAGVSAAQSFTVNQAPVPNLTQTGTIIASVTAPTGLGNKNLSVIRDGNLPPVGTKDPTQQYDTFNGGQPSTDVWIGYQYSGSQTFQKIMYQEGENFVDGGWFNTLTVQVLENGTWTTVSNLVDTPVYTGNDSEGFVTYTLTFTPVTATAIRIDGSPGGGSYFISVGELEVFGPAPASSSPTPTLTAIMPATANNGDSPFKLTVTGTNFVSGSTVQWNGSSRPTTFVSSTQLVAAIPASDVASVGTAQITVATTSAGSSASQSFTINQAPVPNLTQTGTIIASVTAPTGQGNKNLSVIRDGDLPPVGTKDPSRQYDTFDGGQPSTDVWIGYQYSSAQTFTKVVYQEGENFVDGGWFNTPAVQVLENGMWVSVSNLKATPAYTGNDGTGFVTYTLTFSPVSGTAIRIDGPPGGSSYFISVGELEVFGQ